MNPNNPNPDHEEMLDREIEAIAGEPVDEAVVKAASERVWKAISSEAASQTLEPVAAEHSIHGCEDYRAMLPAYRAGTLTEARRLLVADHLSECVACRRVFMGEAPKAEEPVRRGMPPGVRWAIAAMLAVVLGSGAWFLFEQYGPGPAGPAATVAELGGALFRVAYGSVEPLAVGATILPGETVRAGRDGSSVVRLRDGSMVEVRARSDFQIQETRRDVTIRLARGNVIVEAAKRESGHLYVVTPDSRVAVTGTVFSVLSGAKGSRVSVIEGEVRVSEHGQDHVLYPGDQLSSSPQLKPVSFEEEVSWSQYADEHLELMRELKVLADRLDSDVRMPDLRYTSDLRELMPAGTLLYVSVPNLGEALGQAYDIIEQQAEQSDTLRQWWDRASGNDVDQMIDRARRYGEYIGDEVLLVAGRGDDGSLDEPVMVTTTRLSGFPELIKAELEQAGGTTVTLVDSAAAIPDGGDNQLLIYANGDKLAMSPNGGALRRVAAAIEGSAPRFAGAPLETDVAGAYQDGIGLLFAADLKEIAPDDDAFALLGNVRNVVMRQSERNGRPDSRAQLTFVGERTGLGGLLAAPAPIGALDFVSPEAAAVMAAAVNDPAGGLAELIELQPKIGEGLDKAHEELGVDIQSDIVGALGGDGAFALDGPLAPVPSWKLVLEVYDPGRLSWAIRQVVDAVNQHAAEVGSGETLTLDEESSGGLTWYRITSSDSSGSEQTGPFAEIDYVFVDGYLVAAPSRALIEQAISNRAAGVTLASSEQFRQMLPTDGYANFSAVGYQNFQAALSTLANAVPGSSETPLQQMSEVLEPVLVAAYGSNDSITVASSAKAFSYSASNMFGLRLSTAFGTLFGNGPRDTNDSGTAVQ